MGMDEPAGSCPVWLMGGYIAGILQVFNRASIIFKQKYCGCLHILKFKTKLITSRYSKMKKLGSGYRQVIKNAYGYGVFWQQNIGRFRYLFFSFIAKII